MDAEEATASGDLSGDVNTDDDGMGRGGVVGVSALDALSGVYSFTLTV